MAAVVVRERAAGGEESGGGGWGFGEREEGRGGGEREGKGEFSVEGLERWGGEFWCCQRRGCRRHLGGSVFFAALFFFFCFLGYVVLRWGSRKSVIHIYTFMR
jgi:hypothetical protein